MEIEDPPNPAMIDGDRITGLDDAGEFPGREGVREREPEKPLPGRAQAPESEIPPPPFDDVPLVNQRPPEQRPAAHRVRLRPAVRARRDVGAGRTAGGPPGGSERRTPMTDRYEARPPAARAPGP